MDPRRFTTPYPSIQFRKQTHLAIFEENTVGQVICGLFQFHTTVLLLLVSLTKGA